MSENIFKTDDLYIAAALKTAGLRFVGLEVRGMKGTFKFVDSSNREKLVFDYYNGVLSQSVREYVNNWIGFKRLVSEIEKER